MSAVTLTPHAETRLRRFLTSSAIVLAILWARSGEAQRSDSLESDSTTTSTASANVSLRDIDNAPRVPSDVVSGDFNRDGAADLAVAYSFDDEVRWYFGAGDGAFELQGARSVGVHDGALNDFPTALLARDFDADGLLDLAVLSSGNPNSDGALYPSLGILWGAPTGGFEPYDDIPVFENAAPAQRPVFSLALAAGYINGDDRPDLIVGHAESHEITILLGGEGRSFQPPLSLAVESMKSGPIALAAVDLDFDGDDDPIVANRGELQVWRNDGDGEFVRYAFAQGSAFTAIALGDFNRDGRWDVAALDAGEAHVSADDALHLYMGLDVAGNVTGGRIVMPLEGGVDPIDLIVYDADGDGLDDLALIYLNGGGGEIYYGRDDPASPPLELMRRFSTSSRPRSLAVGDFNGDGRIDAVAVNEGDEIDPANQDVSFDFNAIERDRAALFRAGPARAPGEALGPHLSRPRGLAWNVERGSLWTIDRAGRSIIELEPGGGVRGRYPLSAMLEQPPSSAVNSLTEAPLDPTDLAADDDGRLWITDRLGAHVYKFEPGGVRRKGFSTAAAGIARPAGIAFEPVSDRIIVADEVAPILAIFTIGGEMLQTIEWTPMRSLAWRSDSGEVWGIPETQPDRALARGLFTMDSADPTTALTGLGAIAPMLTGMEARSIAIDPTGDRLWLLLDSGALIESSLSGELRTIRELSLLREIRAVATEPEGSTLLADSGLLSTLVRLDERGEVVDSIALNRPSRSARVEVRGLARLPDRLLVLDGRSDSVFVFDLEGRPKERIEMPWIEGLRPRGLHFDPASSRMFVGTPEGALAVGLKLDPEPQLENDPQVAMLPLPATMPLGSISSGPGGSGLTLFSPERRAMLLYDSDLELRSIVGRTVRFPRRFTPLAAAPSPTDVREFLFVGAGETTLLGAFLETEPLAAGPAWARYR